MPLSADDIAQAYQEHNAALRRYAGCKVPPDAVDDVLGAVWLHVVRAAEQYQEQSYLRAWLYRITVTHTARWWRGELRKPTVPFLELPPDRLALLADDGGMEAVIESCDTAMAAVFLRAAMEQLLPHEREAALLLAHRIPGPLAAQRMGRPLAAYHGLLSRAITKLSVALGREHGGLQPGYAWGQAPETCQEPGCDRPYHCSGKCERCYHRDRRKRRRWAAKEARDV